MFSNLYMLRITNKLTSSTSKISFSIFTATHNRANDFLPQCVESIQNQRGNLFDYEHIIINNASTDNTSDYLKRIVKKYPNVKVVESKTNSGTAAAFNKALKIATGDFLIIMGDDDMLLPYSLQAHANFIAAHRKIDWASGFLLLIDENNQLIPNEISILYNQYEYPEAAPELFERLLKGNVIMCSSAIARRESVIELGGCDENVHCED